MFTAIDLFNDVEKAVVTGEHRQDNRCLVPYSHKDPTKWKTYEMHDYRKASNEEELKKVDKFKYDNNFHNWEDPKVLKYFTKNTKGMKKAWKKTHGFPYATAVPPWKPTNESLVYNATKCWKKCASYVSSYYNFWMGAVKSNTR